MKKFKAKGPAMYKSLDAIKITKGIDKDLKKAKIPYRWYSETLLIVNPGIQDLQVNIGDYLIKRGDRYEVNDPEFFEPQYEIV